MWLVAGAILVAALIIDRRLAAIGQVYAQAALAQIQASKALRDDLQDVSERLASLMRDRGLIQ